MFFFLTCTYDCMIMVDICVINVGEYTINGSCEKCEFHAGWGFWLAGFLWGWRTEEEVFFGSGQKGKQGEAKAKHLRKPFFAEV